ncbi:MAG: adenosylcobinamide-phosphate synthase CbiB [Candidatus Omnitrophota bacterium]|nr:adenosylcobinamide-phosphate synthase CbiB [Candidatus Omnitrophota bacterium]
MEIMLAYILDLFFGDPRWLPHPVRGIGWMINKLEPPLRKCCRGHLSVPYSLERAPEKIERIAGILLVILVVGVSWYLGFITIKLAYSMNRYLGSIISILIIYTLLAVKDLDVESTRVYHSLEQKDIISARKKLSLIVGRDTDNLEDKEIVRATVETVAENIVDGVISPLFYAFIGGAPLALAYKAVSTLDSMVGYKNEKYKDFGWASAKLDTLANFIPARLCIIFLPLAGLLAGKDGLSSWRITRRDGGKNPSLNSGIAEAAIAGALGVQLGGLNFYNSVSVLKPLIGDNLKALEPRHIRESIRISYICSALFLISGVFLIA